MAKKLLTALSVVLCLAGGLYFYAQQRAAKVVNQQFERLITSKVYDTAEYESLELDMTGDMHLTNVRVGKDGNDVVLQQVHITNLDYAHETPWHLDLEIEGIHFPNGLPDSASLANMASAAGFIDDFAQDDTIPVTVRYAYDYDPENSHQLTFDAGAALPDSFTLSLSGESLNVPLDTIAALNNGAIPEEQTLATVTELMSVIAIPQAKVSLLDQGLVEQLLTQSAAQSGMTTDALREQWKSQARNYYLFMPQDLQGIGMQAGSQIASFLDGGRTLNIAIQPEFGGSFSQLQAQIMGAVFTGEFRKIVDLLHLEIQAQ